MPFLVNPQREAPRRDYSRKQRVEDDRLFSRMQRIPVSLTVWKDRDGVWRTGVADATSADLVAAQRVYAGGHVNEVSDEEAAELAAAGFEVVNEL